MTQKIAMCSTFWLLYVFFLHPTTASTVLTQTHTNKQTCVYIYILYSFFTYLFVYLFSHSTHAHTHTHTYIYIYIYIYVCACFWGCQVEQAERTDMWSTSCWSLYRCPDGPSSTGLLQLLPPPLNSRLLQTSTTRSEERTTRNAGCWSFTVHHALYHAFPIFLPDQDKSSRNRARCFTKARNSERFRESRSVKDSRQFLLKYWCIL